MNPRELFFDKVYKKVVAGEDIVIVTPDLAAPSLDQFRRDYPERYISVGVAEQSLISTACGLALGGKRVIAWGLNPFVVTRGLDQIRNTISLMKIPIVFAGLHTGLSSAISGPTHVVITDLALVKTCENITIYNPSDCNICDRIFEDVLHFDRPCYLRFDKDINYELVREYTYYPDGFSIVVKGDNSTAIISTGFHVNICKEMIEEENREITLIDVFRMPCNKDSLFNEIKRFKQIITVEEHILQGGFGSFILEVIADHKGSIPVKRIGIDLEKGYPDFFGTRAYFENYMGLDKQGIKIAIDSIIDNA